MKISQIAAKSVVRVFFMLLLVAMIPFLQGDTNKLKHIYLLPKQLWTLAFPALLVLGFIALLILCSVKKFTKPDLNWLLVINAAVLIAYTITVYISIYGLIK